MTPPPAWAAQKPRAVNPVLKAYLMDQPLTWMGDDVQGGATCCSGHRGTWAGNLPIASFPADSASLLLTPRPSTVSEPCAEIRWKSLMVLTKVGSHQFWRLDGLASLSFPVSWPFACLQNHGVPDLGLHSRSQSEPPLVSLL